MIDRPLVTPDFGNGIATPGAAPIDLGDTAYSIPGQDGGMDVFLEDSSEQADLAALPFEANLAEALDQSTLQHISNDLQFVFNEDKTSRKEWEDALVKGLDLL